MVEPVKKLLDVPEEADEICDADITEAGPHTDPTVLVARAGVVIEPHPLPHPLADPLAPLAPPEVLAATGPAPARHVTVRLTGLVWLLPSRV